MEKRIITISRQFGSGGRTIGRLVAEKLGVPCYDKELIEKVAAESGYASDYVAEEGEYAPSRGILAYSFLGRGIDGLSNADRLWFAQKKVVEKLAEDGPCVIVGRCADYILREREDSFHVFVSAAESFRAKRIVEQYGELTQTPEKRLADKDKKRKLNYRYFTGREWGNRENYNLCLDSGVIGIERSADLIVLAAGGSTR